MLEQSLVEPEELDESNFQEFLEDETFVDYFNTFLALPCFAERLFYNREFDQFEEFVEKLADDVGKGDAVSAYQLRKLNHFKGTIYNVSNNQSRIGYYVIVLDKIQAVEFVQSFRIPIFLKSELYAEYKLTMILSTIQSSLIGNFVEYEDTNSFCGSQRRSIVSFNLDGSAVEDQMNPFDDRSTADSPHIRTIDDTFTAWQDSFKRADSRASLFGYAGGSSLRTPDVATDTDSETSSTYSDRQQQFSRPQSAFSRPRGSAKVTWGRHTSHENNEIKKSLSDSNLQSQKNEKKVEEEAESLQQNANNTNKEQGSVNNIHVDNEMDYKSTNQETLKTQVVPSEEEITRTQQDKNPAGMETVDNYSSNENLSVQAQISQDENGERKGSIREAIVTERRPEKDSKQPHQENIAESGTEKKDNSSAESLMNPREKSKQSTTSLSDMSSEVSIPIIISDESSEITSVGISITNDIKSTNYKIQENETAGSAETKVLDTESKIDLSTCEHKMTDRESEHQNERQTVNKIEKTDENKMGEENVDEDQEISAINAEDVEKKREVDEIKNEEEGKQEMVQKKDSTVSHLNIEGDDDNAEDFDLETNSEYTLKGIRGILRRRASVAATSVGFDFDQSDISEDDYVDEDKPYDLATKEGLDEFKEFLLGTVAEKYLRLWIDIECLRHDKGNNLIAQTILQKYFKKGGLYELTPENIKRLELQDLSKVTYDELKDKCCRFIEPILDYWCARFTMHQQNRGNPTNSLDYTRITEDVPKSVVSRENGSTSVTLDPNTCGMSQVTYTKQLLRPQSSRPHAQSDSEGSRPLTAKHRKRAKSAHPRLIPAPTPLDTNASTIQLQNITSPFRGNYGFKPKKAPTFSKGVEPDYMSSVRLYINPVPTPDGKLTKMLGKFHRTAVSPEKHKTKNLPEDHVKSDTDTLIDSLIEGLILEKQTGGYFEEYLHKVGNKQWLDCLAFWKDLQEYNGLFFADSLNPSTLSRKAKLMYAQYVVGSGAQAIGVSHEIQRQVFKQVDPPYEELFDAVEDHALRCLIQPWKHLQDKEKISYKSVKTEQKLRHIEIQVMARRRQSVVQTRELDGTESDMEKEKISIDEANRPMPIPKDGFSFEMLIRNRKEVEFFREFLSKKHTKGIKDLVAWTDMETFRRLPRFMEEKRDQKAKDVKNSWLTKKYFFGMDSPATREGQDLIMNINGGRTIKERPSTPVITECQKFVRARIERRWLMLFKQTAEFLERQKPRVTAPEIVEDVMLKRRLQRSEAAWKILNSRWVSSSRDVVALRTCLLNPQTCAEFRTFVALKGDTFENDVDFWLEVQKFKDLCHAHSQESFIRRKVQAITDCFLNSAIAPELQIDIPIEMAEKLLERLTGRITVHPYIFREAQMTVFRMLFNHWKEFIGYRSKVPADKTLLEHLDERLKSLRAENKAKREASERRRQARLSAERKKKEKEERERKRMEDLTSLFSIDTASVFYSEAPDDELNSWLYSKHVVEQERLEHIKKLKEQGLEIPPELLLEDKDDMKSRRSRLSSSKLQSFDLKSLRSKRKSVSGLENSERDSSDKEVSKSPQIKLQLQNMQRHQLSNRLGSFSTALSISVPRRNSVFSRKSDKLSSKDERMISENETKAASPNEEIKNVDEVKTQKAHQPEIIVDEIQVIPDNDDIESIKQDKLLNARTQKAKRIFHKQPKKKEVPLDAISCISDYSEFSNIDFRQKKRPISPKKKSGAATPLTFKSLKDFTNSPEGAPLAVPLPLVRITSASNKDAFSDDDGSQGNTLTKSRNVFASPQPRLTSAKRKHLVARKQESIVPDVVVN